MGHDWLSVIDAAYDLVASEEVWLGALLDAARPLMPRASHAYAATYDASNSNQLRIESVVLRDFPQETTRDDVLRATASLVLGHRRFEESREERRLSSFAKYDVENTFAVNAIDPAGLGCLLAFVLTRETSSLPKRRSLIARASRVTAHIAAARRLRMRLRAQADPQRDTNVEALLTTHERIENFIGDAMEPEREALQTTVLSLERVRGDLRKTAPDSALAGWPAMVRARWTLVDHFEKDGKRYLLAVRSEAAMDGMQMLSPRERQVVSYASLGHSNKMIAYELGIATSTVGVLLSRATTKLGVSSREELLAKLRAE